MYALDILGLDIMNESQLKNEILETKLLHPDYKVANRNNKILGLFLFAATFMATFS